MAIISNRPTRVRAKGTWNLIPDERKLGKIYWLVRCHFDGAWCLLGVAGYIRNWRKVLLTQVNCNVCAYDKLQTEKLIATEKLVGSHNIKVLLSFRPSFSSAWSRLRYRVSDSHLIAWDNIEKLNDNTISNKFQLRFTYPSIHQRMERREYVRQKLI